ASRDLRRGVLHGLDDVHVAGAAAEVAGDGPADVVLAGLGVLVQEGIAGHQHAGRTVSALQPVLGHEAFLQGMELAVLLEPFHRHELLAPGLDGEQRARLHRPPIHQDRAGAAVGGVAADVGAGQPEHVAQHVHEQEARLDVGLVRLTVDRKLDQHHALRVLARSTALRSARAVKIRTRSFLYSTEPRRSADGSAASAASSAARLIAASSGALPFSEASAFVAWVGGRPTLVNPMPTWSHEPFAPSVPWTATAAVAKSPTLRSSFR